MSNWTPISKADCTENKPDIAFEKEPGAVTLACTKFTNCDKLFAIAVKP